MDTGLSMKDILQKILIIIACMFSGHGVFGQTNKGGLTVSAEGYLLTNIVPQLVLTVHLINTTNHDITVLTKEKTSTPMTMWIPINETPEPKTFQCTIGLYHTSKHQGHLIVPALSELAPVTLKPNEEALVPLTIEQNKEHPNALEGVTKDTLIIMRYFVTAEWGTRFGCWSGMVSSEPFKATLIRVPEKKP